jgi:hypothetical protein
MIALAALSFILATAIGAAVTLHCLATAGISTHLEDNT